MSTLTSRYKLIKPSLTDVADITETNANWDKIDAALGYAGYIQSAVITSGQDLNDCISFSLYRCKSNAIASTLSNSPTNNAFSLFVLPHTDNGVTQLLTEYMTSGARQFRRNKYNGSWGAWIDLSSITSIATQESKGLMSPSDKKKLDGLNFEWKYIKGDGKFGSNNPKSISFSFAPSMLVLMYSTDSVGYFVPYATRTRLYNGNNPPSRASTLQLTKNYQDYTIYQHNNPILVCDTPALTTSYVEGFFLANSVCVYKGNRGNTPATYCKKSSDGKTITFYAERNGASETVFPDSCIANLQLNEQGSAYAILAIGSKANVF